MLFSGALIPSMPVAFGYSPAPPTPDPSPLVYIALPCPLAAGESDKRAEINLVSQHSWQGPVGDSR